MKLSRNQWITILGFTILFAILYFGFDTKSSEQKELVKARSQNLELINIERIISEEKASLPGDILYTLEELEQKLANSESDSLKAETLKAIASLWYSADNALVSAHYAERVATILEDDALAWSISGTSFAIASKRIEDENQTRYAIDKSRQSLESAVSLDPENISYQINLALSYVDFPLEENPMQGILMLVDLNKKYPENVPVLVQLGRLALGTNQLEKAVERLTKATQLDPGNRQAHCLLADVYTRMGDVANANREQELCDS